jgi:hypothetical protein
MLGSIEVHVAYIAGDDISIGKPGEMPHFSANVICIFCNRAEENCITVR